MTFDELMDALAAVGIDLKGLVSLAQERLTAEDLQSLAQIQSQEIPLIYLWSTEHEVSVEPNTGVIVDSVMAVEKTSLQIDDTAIMGLVAIFMNYQFDPVLGPAISQLMEQAAGLEEASVFLLAEYYLSQTQESVYKAT